MRLNVFVQRTGGVTDAACLLLYIIHRAVSLILKDRLEDPLQ